jgi:CBS domain-containing protein
MPNQKKVREVMIPLKDYPHIPQWFTLRQAVAIVRESTIKYAGVYKPRAVLVFDQDHRLAGILTIRGLLKGLQLNFLQGAVPVPAAATIDDLLGPDLKQQADRPVSEVMAPVKASVQADASLVQALFAIIKENVGTMPVLEDDKVVGMVRLTELFLEISREILERTDSELP